MGFNCLDTKNDFFNAVNFHTFSRGDLISYLDWSFILLSNIINTVNLISKAISVNFVSGVL